MTRQLLLAFAAALTVTLLPGDSGHAQGEAPASAPAPVTAPDPHAESLKALSLKRFSETRAPGFRATIPEMSEKAVRQSVAAATELSMRFNSPTEADSAIEATYAGEKTQAPVISAVFDTENSDSLISAEAFRASRDRTATVAYKVLSAPRNFGPYGILMEHWHVNEKERALLKTVQFANQETFTVQRTTVSGLLPGVNQFVLRVRLRGANGETTSAESATHVVVVDEVAAMGLEQSPSAEARVQQIGALTRYLGAASHAFRFTLTPAVSLSNVSVKVQRRGSRIHSVDGVPRGIQSDMDRARVSSGWEDFALLPLVADSAAPGVQVLAGADRSWAVTLTHQLRASASVAPLTDAWEYRVMLYHPNYAQPLDTMTCHFAAGIGGADGNWIGSGVSRDAVSRTAFTE